MKWRTEKELHSNDGYLSTYHSGVTESFESFRERILLYELYKDRPHWLRVKHPDIWKMILNNAIYVNWLFEYCFGDVLLNE